MLANRLFGIATGAKLERDIATVADDPGADLDQLSRAGSRATNERLRGAAHVGLGSKAAVGEARSITNQAVQYPIMRISGQAATKTVRQETPAVDA